MNHPATALADHSADARKRLSPFELLHLHPEALVLVACTCYIAVNLDDVGDNSTAGYSSTALCTHPPSGWHLLFCLVCDRAFG